MSACHCAFSLYFILGLIGHKTNRRVILQINALLVPPIVFIACLILVYIRVRGTLRYIFGASCQFAQGCKIRYTQQRGLTLTLQHEYACSVPSDINTGEVYSMISYTTASLG